MIKKTALLNLLLFGSLQLTAQNLVPNGDMEGYSACPTSLDYSIGITNDWTTLTGHGGTVSYFNSCGEAQYDWTNFADDNTVTPHSGDGYIGLGTYSDFDQRSYAEVMLTSPLTAGQSYEVSMWIYGGYADYVSSAYCNNVGIYISSTDPSVSGCGMCVEEYAVTPVVVSGQTANEWVEVTTNYIAVGGEQYLVIGNFSDNAGTTAIANGAATMGGITAFTFIDDVVVQPGTSCETFNTISATTCSSYSSPSGNYTWTAAGAYNDTIPNAAGCDSVITVNLSLGSVDTQVNESGITLSANATGLTYQWVDCNDNYASISGANSNDYTPTANGSYAVIITDGICSDTSSCITISTVGVENLSATKQVSIFPNPGNGAFTVDLTNIEGTVEVTMYSADGRLIFTEERSGNKLIDYDLSVPQGTYRLRLKTETGILQSAIHVF